AGITNGTSELVVFNRNSRFHALPLNDRDKISAVSGVRKVAYWLWFGGYYQDPRNQLYGFAVSPDFTNTISGFEVPVQELAAWEHDRHGVIVGEEFAKRFGWRVGSHIPVLNSGGFTGRSGHAWNFNIDAIAHSTVVGR